LIYSQTYVKKLVYEIGVNVKNEVEVKTLKWLFRGTNY